ncbi:RNA polymerase sigma factor [Streptomyces sp. NPDC002491]
MSSQANAKISPKGGLTAALVAQAAAGDRDAFATLYNEYQPEVYRYLKRRTQNHTLAEDLTSETFIRALRNIATFANRPGSGGVGAWLCVIARNLHTDHCKASRTRLEVSTPALAGADDQMSWLESLTPTGESAESVVLRQLDADEAAAIVRAAMTSLTPPQQQVIRMRFLEELPLAEATARLGRKTNAVKTLTDRAKAGLRAGVHRNLAAKELAA